MAKLLSLFLLVWLVAISFAGPVRSKTLTVKSKIDHGCVVFLSDGTGWEIRQENRAKVDAWPAKARVAIYKINDRGFPYRIVLDPDGGSGDVVSANRLLRVR